MTNESLKKEYDEYLRWYEEKFKTKNIVINDKLIKEFRKRKK